MAHNAKGLYFDVHLYFGDSRLYQVMVATSAGQTATFRDAFFNSFQNRRESAIVLPLTITFQKLSKACRQRRSCGHNIESASISWWSPVRPHSDFLPLKPLFSSSTIRRPRRTRRQTAQLDLHQPGWPLQHHAAAADPSFESSAVYQADNGLGTVQMVTLTVIALGDGNV